MVARLPDDEDARLAALREHHILDTAPQEEFDDLVRLAADICGVPIAAVTLIDEHRQWFKAITGLEATETPRDAAFCAHTILQSDLMMVPDTQTDPRFADHPLVTGDPHIRFYAGVPLVTEEGYALGSLCVIDTTPRRLTPTQEARLRLLARQVSGHLRAARRMAERERLVLEAEKSLQESRSRLAEAQRVARIGSWEYDIAQDRILWSDELFELFEMDPAEGAPSVEALMAHYHPDDVPMHQEVVKRVIADGLPYEFDIRIVRRDGTIRWAHAAGRGERNAAGQVARLTGTLMDIHERKSVEEALRESKQFIESVTEHSTSIIFVFDLDTMAVVYTNRSVAESLGFSAEQVQAMGGDLLPLMLHPDDLPRIQAHFGQFADTADGEVVEVEYRARHVSGEWRWIWNRETVFKRHPDGTPRQILGTAYDVTERKQAQEEGARLAAIVESSRDAILAVTLDGMLVSWNAAAEKLYGYTEAEIIGQHASVLAPPSERRFTADVKEAILRGERRENIEVKRKRKNGAWIDVSLTFSPIKNAAEQITGIAAIARDITIQKRAEEALHQSEEALRAIMEGAPIVLYATDLEGIVTLSEGTGLERLGRLPGEVVGQSVFEMYQDRPDIAGYLRRALQGEAVSYDAQVRDLCYHNEVRPQRDKDGLITGLIGVAHDVTDRKQAEQALKDFSVVLEFQKQELEKANAELANLATRDGLTGLLNRRAFDDRFQEEFERASRYHKPLSLLLLDIDRFKQYNDRFGHQAGDEALRRIGRILEKATRETDFVARYGGEEIAVILPETDGDGAMQVAERIRMAVATAPWDHREVTVSLGVCTLRLDMTHPDEMVFCADSALYESKAAGRNRVMHGHTLSAARGRAQKTKTTG